MKLNLVGECWSTKEAFIVELGRRGVKGGRNIAECFFGDVAVGVSRLRDRRRRFEH